MKAKHNDVYVSHHKVEGWSERKAYIFKEYVNGPKWIPFTTDYGDYLCGYLPPRYPVPAIPIFASWDKCYSPGRGTKVELLLWKHGKDGNWVSA